jgi:hypothetical protein
LKGGTSPKVTRQIVAADELVLRCVRDNSGSSTEQLRAIFVNAWRRTHGTANCSAETLRFRLAEGLQRLRITGRVRRDNGWVATGTED